MFVLYADKTRLTVRQLEPVTSGSVNVYHAQFQFSLDWDGLTRKAVFKAGAVSRSVLLGETGQCIVPWEVFVKPNIKLQVGVYGTKGGEVVLPTIWADLGTIQEGATTGDDSQPPTPDLWEQQLAAKGDALEYDGINLSLMSGENPLSTVQIADGGGGGTSDHRLLSHRDEKDQHPIKAITKLSQELDMRLSADSVITSIDIIKIMEG